MSPPSSPATVQQKAVDRGVKPSVNDKTTGAWAPVVSLGGGGGIRTPDLWVMSPTSYRCSTPRHSYSIVLHLTHVIANRFGGARSGLASRGATPQYSPALRWVTTGFGMGPGGATALWATSPPEPIRITQVWDDGGGVDLPGGNKAKAGWGHRYGDRPRP